MQHLKHPNIVQMYEYANTRTEGVIVLEYVPCLTLEELLKQGPLLEMHVKTIISHLLNTLDYVHSQNVVHRDLKPANIFVTRDHNIKLMDWGLSFVHSDQEPSCMIYCGTPLYCSPEVLDQLPHDPFLAEMWAVGIITYQMFYIHLPFGANAESFEELSDEIYHEPIKFPPAFYFKSPSFKEPTLALQDFIVRLLDKDPESRMDLIGALQHPFISNI